MIKKFVRTICWFVIINFCVCNQIWQEPIPYWWVVEIIVLGISIFIS
jgi:hypothetical protein